MSRARVCTSLMGAVFCLTLVSSVRADSMRPDMLLEKLFYAERHNLTGFDMQLAETEYLYAGHFENNNGKHLGFSMTAVRREPILGIVRPPISASVSPNPEPTAILLLGTGLAAAGALARKLKRRRRV